MSEWIFPGRNDRYDVEDEFNALQLELCEAAEVAFQVRGRNRFTFSRLFFPFETAPAERSTLVNHTGNQRFEMEEGMIYFLPSGIDFEFDFRSTTRFLSFHFHLRRYGREIFAGREECECRSDRSGRIPQLLKLMRQPCLTLSGHWQLRSLLTGEIARCLPPETVPPASEHRSGYAGLLRFLREEAHGALSIGDLAEVAGMPQERLSREFSRDFGVPLKRFLAQSITARAEALLRNPECKVREAARLLKFRDEYYFSRFFKRETGTSPADYRKLREGHRKFCTEKH